MKINPIVYIVAGVLILIGLFFLFKPKTTVAPATFQNERVTPATNATKKTFDLTIKNKKIISGKNILKATQGDEVTINIMSDIPEEIHIHGYDKSIEFEASEQATLTFTADTSGRFPFELEESKTELGFLEVQPK